MEGDTITIYEVSEIFEVGPTDNSVTHPTDDPTLTLITCTNWQDSRGVFADRLVVRAIPVGSN
jgi:sortase (surface protein transpeptidase)